MNHLTFKTPVNASAESLFRWHTRSGAFERLTPPWAPVRLEEDGGVREGARSVIRLGPGPASIRWVAEHYDVEEGRQFCDRQVEGPFSHWEHTHRMEPQGDNESLLVDEIEYQLPLGGVGQFFGGSFSRDRLRRQFAYRHRVTRNDLDLHQQYNPRGDNLTVAVSGASGFVGSMLVPFLTTGGHTVKRLVRSQPTEDDEIYWDHRAGAIETEKLEGVDAVIHLAGENVFALRWTKSKKQRIMNSRAEGTRLISEALAHLDDPPEVFLSASAVGYYGDQGTDIITEDTPPRGTGFLTEVCEAWEDATTPAQEAGIRTAQLRTGIVLSPAGGALELMLPAFRMGLGGRVGAPDQYFPWIAMDDVIGGFYHALMTDTVKGPVNLTAPYPVRMEDYAETLAEVLSRPAFLNVPSAAVRTALGEMADEMILKSARAVPEQLQDTGYEFLYPELDEALRHLLGKTLQPHRAWSP